MQLLSQGKRQDQVYRLKSCLNDEGLGDESLENDNCHAVTALVRQQGFEELEKDVVHKIERHEIENTCSIIHT